jgi:putative phage-type endonuclease
MSLSAAQLAARAEGLGSSEISAVIGVSPHQTAFDLYCLKTGLVAPKPATLAQEIGHALEDPIAQLYLRRMRAAAIVRPREVITGLVADDTTAHPEHPWALATPDRFAVYGTFAEGHLVEIKNVGGWMTREWGEDGTDDVPLHYLAQCTWQMGVTGVHRCDLVALLGGSDLRVYPLAFDAELFARLLAAGRRFWFDHVRARVAPPIDGSDSARRYLDARYPRAADARSPAPPLAEVWAAQLIAARAAQADAERERGAAENALRALLGAREGFDGAGWRLTWRAGPKGGARRFLFRTTDEE